MLPPTPQETLRLLSLAKRLELSTDLQSHLKTQLISTLTPSQFVDGANLKSRKLEDGANQTHWDAKFNGKNHQQNQIFTHDSEFQGLELKLRQLVAADMKWPALKTTAWRLFRLNSHDESAARLVETALISASIHETCDVLAALNEEGFEYYFKMSEKAREHLCFKLMQHRKLETLVLFLGEDFNSVQNRLPIEHLFIFGWLQGSDAARSFIYFRHYETEIYQAVQKFGESLGQGPNIFFLEQAKKLVAMNMWDQAKQLIKQIDQSSDEFAQALELVMLVEHSPEKIEVPNYFSQIESEKDWQKRLSLVQSFLDDCRTRKDKSHLAIAAMNEICARLLSYLPTTASSWEALVRLLITNQDLVVYLPDLFQALKDRASRFDSEIADQAFWRTLHSDLPESNPEFKFWHGVALLHLYIHSGPESEENLWTAKDFILQAHIECPTVLPFTWNELQRAAFEYVVKSFTIRESARHAMLSQLKLTDENHHISMPEIEEYVAQCSNKPFAVLNRVQSLIAAKGAKSLELRLLLRRSESFHYRNEDLQRIWELALDLNDFDLCWRVATIAKSRGALRDEMIQPWAISGENRSSYALHSIHKDHVPLIIQNLSKKEKQLSASIINVGHLIPELLLAIEPDRFQLGRFTNPQQNTPEAAIAITLDQNAWMAKRKRPVVLFDNAYSASTAQVPAFVHMLPDNYFASCFVAIAERLGISTWRWKVEFLQDALEDAKNSSTASAKSLKLAQWLRKLTPTQRTSWQHLNSLPTKDPSLDLCIASLVTKISLCSYPAHDLALQTLKTMRAPVAIIWDLEKWLLSAEYTKIRRDCALGTRSVVQANWRRLMD